MLPTTNLPVIVIPAYQPTDALEILVRDITTTNSLQPIIVVNDGSSDTAIFTRLATFDNVTVLHHACNLGKGQALKTAFNYYLLNYSNSPGVVTADADGQHTVADIQQIMQKLILTPNAVWLGSRKLNNDVPLRSRFGNSITRKVFQLIMGKSVYDTQTGLRGIPRSLLPDLLRIPTSRYEYELDMLMTVIRKKIEIHEVTIQTIYIDGNKSSHFNPVIDSLKIYFVFLRYLTVSASSACIDFIAFVFFHFLFPNILFSLTSARLISGTYNFILGKKMIFKSSNNTFFEAIKYLGLAIFSLTLSYILVLGLVKDYSMNLYLSKIIADVCVFIINFAIQKVVVFQTKAIE